MPQALIGALTPYVASFLFGIGGNALAVAATGLLASALVYGGLAAAAYLVQSAFAPAKPDAPKPEDGKFNLKQSVPPLVYVLGRVKKAGDYAFLEERGGTAWHITVVAAHRIEAFVQHWLNDEAVAINSGGTVTSPTHYDNKVRILTRLGNSASTAYEEVIGAFPDIWTSAHRGDGLATVEMDVQSVASDALQVVYPQGMPQHSATIDGHNQLIDPRTGVQGYSRNLAIFRAWHLCHPVGGKLNWDDLYLPDWAHAAEVCDQMLTNRVGTPVARYHGGLWFRANNDPVEIGRLMDQAAELVIFERSDGRVGVHAGEFVAADVRLTANDLISVSFDANKRRGTNVMAVRGRYTDPAKGYNTADAAIYGLPYPSDDERTKTVDNQAVQNHNHIARLQKLAYIRANAPRVKLVAHYEPARLVPYRRFVTVHYPPKMTEAVVEITGRPTLSLRNLTYTFEGIIVPSELYAFVASTDEGEPGANVIPVARGDIPEPENFEVIISQEEVGGGSTAAFAKASFDFQHASFQYEFEWQPTSGGAAQSVLAAAGALDVRSTYLADGVQYRFRARTWSVGASSDWSDYIILTSTADPAAPGAVTGVSATSGAGQIAFAWTAPNSANYASARLYVGATNVFGSATLVALEYGAPNAADNRVVNGLAAGTYYGWVVATNASGVAASPVATGAQTVT